MQRIRFPRLAPIIPATLLLTFLAGPALAQHYTQANLVSNQPGAAHTDVNLVNGWGIARSATSPWWVSDNGKDKATIYNVGTGSVNSTITVPGGPTGMVFNGTSAFSVLGGAPAHFIFASEDGTISAWNGGATAQVVATTVGAVYKGIAIASVNGNPQLYATDFHNGHIDVFDANFQLVTTGKGKGADHGDDNSFFSGKPRGFAPFNIQNIGDTLYVTFAKQDAARHDEVDGPGLGLIGAFTPTGKLIQWFEHVNDLNAPWGLALAPSEFGTFSHHLLVGQFGSGEILAFNLASGAFAGKLLQPMAAGGAPISIDGLWGIGFGSGAASSGPLNTLFFAAGPNGESNGLFGSLTPVAADLIQGNSN
jgi:uncharacterized protein (TIGR03118 family)